MFETIVYGFSFGAILYLFSIGLALTFGTMHVINFSHGMVYALGVYLFIALKASMNVGFIIPMLIALAIMVFLSWGIERFIIRRLYGVRLDYAIIATYALLLIGTDIIKTIWGSLPMPVSVPIKATIAIANFNLPVYRVIIFVAAIVIFLALKLFFRKTVVGQIVVAAMQDDEGVRCLGINVNTYFSIVFVIGSGLAILGGILYAPISTTEPYMGYHILLIAFAVVIVGGMGNLTGTFFGAFALGMIMSIVGRINGGAANAVAFLIMALVILIRSKLHPEEGE